DTTRAPTQGPRPKGGRHDAALSFPFGIGTRAANPPKLTDVHYLISQPPKLHFTLNHYTCLPRYSRPGGLVRRSGGRSSLTPVPRLTRTRAAARPSDGPSPSASMKGVASDRLVGVMPGRPGLPLLSS